MCRRTIMPSRKCKSLFILSVLAAASFNAAACYTVYDGSDRVVYQGQEAPVDLSQPLNRAIQARFPGGHMVFEQAARCEPISHAQQMRKAPQVAAAPASVPNTAVMGAGPASGKVDRSAVRPAALAGNSPMLTHRQTAISMNVPYRVLSGDIVVVPAQAAGQVGMSTVTVVPPGVVAARATRSETVITELHNPPLTVVQRGQDMVVASR
jgi:hypothetical protein